MRKFFSFFIPLILLLAIPFTLVMVKKQQEIRQRAESGLIAAQVNNQSIASTDYEKAKSLMAILKKKPENDNAVKKEALSVLIDSQLIEKDLEKDKLKSEIQNLADQRYKNLSYQAKATQDKNLGPLLKQDPKILKSYLFLQAAKERLGKEKAQWAVIDYVSIRYLWHKEPKQEEIGFKNTAAKKIKEYSDMLQGGSSIGDVIRLRCQNNELNYLPFETHLKAYSMGFDGKLCREQRLNFKVSKDTNPEWGDAWLKQVLSLEENKTSEILNFESGNVGFYYLVKVNKKGIGTFFSFSDYLNSLRVKNSVKIYAQ